MTKVRKVGIPSGGSTNQVLKKSSNNDYEVEWGTGGGGSGTINSGSQYRLPYYSTNPSGTTLDPAAAITGGRLLKSDANGVPTHTAYTESDLTNSIVGGRLFLYYNFF